VVKINEIRRVKQKDAMHYPLWNMPLLGGALVIAGISIIHVVIAHFAVGAGIFNLLSEARAYRKNDPVLLTFVRDNSSFIIYFPFVAGAVSGVGIWFTIGTAAPEASTFLIRLFLWVWAMEWVFFIVELAAGYVYYYTWDRLSRRAHLLVALVYAVSAFMSLVLINGILTFMLTPGAWTQTGALRDAWYNPSFLPSTAMRTVSSLALAGIFVAIVASARSAKYDRAQRTQIIKWGSLFLMPLALMPVLAYWYFSTVPESARRYALGDAVAMTFIFAFGIIASFLVGVYSYFGMYRKARDINIETALLMAAIAFVATASSEFVREGIRKPYVLMDVMYSSGILLTEVPKLQQEGVLTHTEWIVPDTVHYSGTVATGEAIYRAECLRCHEVKGYNAMTPLVHGWNRELVVSALNDLSRLKAYIPPFIGTGWPITCSPCRVPRRSKGTVQRHRRTRRRLYRREKVNDPRISSTARPGVSDQSPFRAGVHSAYRIHELRCGGAAGDRVVFVGAAERGPNVGSLAQRPASGDVHVHDYLRRGLALVCTGTVC
jgi:cytochrome bd ubiquinol oxidase subunit I